MSTHETPAPSGAGDLLAALQAARDGILVLHDWIAEETETPERIRSAALLHHVVCEAIAKALTPSQDSSGGGERASQSQPILAPNSQTNSEPSAEES